MKEYMEIDPHISVGPYYLGASKSELEKMLGEATDSFKRTAEATEVVMAYDSEALHITIGSDKKAKILSFFTPNQILLKGVQLLGRLASEVYSELQSAGIQLDKNDVGMWCKGLGVNLVEAEGIIDGVEITNEKQA
jgi:hypothetical protein